MALASNAGRIGRLGLVASLAAAMTVVTAAAPAQANSVIIVSEVAPWASENSTYAADWFELTNTGSTAIDITGWRFSNSSTSSVGLTGITSIAAGESVIFLESSTPETTIGLFTAAWFGSSVPAGLQVGSYESPFIGLSTSGDEVNLFSRNGPLSANISFGASPAAAPFATFDNAAGLDNAAVSALSVAGVNGAFLVSTGTPAIGSPGSIGDSTPPPVEIPEVPAAVLASLFAASLMGGALLLARRKAAIG